MPDLLQFFTFGHLPGFLQPTSASFANLANLLLNELPDNPERDMAFRKLLEAKDCAVRSLLYKEPTP